MSTTPSVHNPTGRLVRRHPGVVKVGRVGWFAKGLVYSVAGALALLVALRGSRGSAGSASGGTEASPTGALKAIAGSAGGPLLLGVLVVGLLVYAAWRLVSAFLPGGSGAEAWAKRIGYVVSAAIYASFAATAFALATGEPTTSKDGNAQVSTTSGRIMRHTGGRVLVGAVGLVVIGAGLYRVAKGARRDVRDELDLSPVPAARRRWYVRLGAVGEVGRGVGIGLVGYFLLRSAVTYDAGQATGLDGALRTLVTKTGGFIVVVVVGIGFVGYGLFCLATFTHRRLEAP